MRKSIGFILIIVGMVLGFGVFNSLVKSGNVEQAVPAIPNSPAGISQQSASVAQIAAPSTFSIPKLGVNNVEVESVGLDKESKMDIPKDEDNVAWYNLGAKPGERGNAVIAGHFDNKDGSPSVFYDINKLKPGDELKVKDKDGKEYIYAVTEVKTYELTEFPLIEVFGAGDKPMLNLITCEGEYDKSSKLYSHRLVVYSELQSD